MNTFKLTNTHQAILDAAPVLTFEELQSRTWHHFKWTLVEGIKLWRDADTRVDYITFRKAVRALLRKGLLQFHREGYETRYYKFPPSLFEK